MSYAHRVLSGLIKRLDPQLSLPAPPPELFVIVDELNKLRQALEADTPTEPSANLLPAYSLVWLSLARSSQDELAKVLKNVLAAVVVAVGEVVVKARAVEDASTAARQTRTQLGAARAEETASESNECEKEVGRDEVSSASDVASGWELVMLRLWEGVDDPIILYRAPELRDVARDLKRDSVHVTMLHQFKHDATWIPLKIQIGRMLLNELKYSQPSRNHLKLTTASVALGKMLATASHVSLAHVILDLAVRLCPSPRVDEWGAHFFNESVYKNDAPSLQSQFGDLHRIAHERSEGAFGDDDEVADFVRRGLQMIAHDETRHSLLKRALGTDPARAQSLDLAIAHAYPLTNPARARTFDKIKICPECGESGHGPGRLEMGWAINKHSIEAVVVNTPHEMHTTEFDLCIRLEDVAHVELLANSVTREFACKVTTSCAPTLAGKALQPAKLGPVRGSSWQVEGDSNHSHFEKETWVVIFVCEIDDGLIDLGPVFDDRAKRYPNFKRSPLKSLGPHLGASEVFLDYITRLAPVQANFELSDSDDECEGNSGTRASDTAPSAQTSPESFVPAKRKATDESASVIRKIRPRDRSSAETVFTLALREKKSLSPLEDPSDPIENDSDSD